MTTVEQHRNIPEWTIGERLAKAREWAGMDQETFAERIGVSRSTVSNYERGRSEPKRIVLNAWAMATGVPLVWLQTGESPRTGGPDGGVAEQGSTGSGPDASRCCCRDNPGQRHLTIAA